MLEPRNTCRLCKSMKEIEKDLKDSEFRYIFLLITKTKIEDTIFSMVCTKCHRFLDSMWDFFKQCNESNEYFKEIEKQIQVEPTIFEFPLNFVSVKVEEKCSDSFDFTCDSDRPLEQKNILGVKSQKLLNDSPNFQCDLCSRLFNRKDSLAIHVKNHLAQKLECTICKNWYNGKNNLKLHLKRHHKLNKTGRKEFLKDAEQESNAKGYQTFIEKKKVEKQKRVISCQICNLVFTETHSLSYHKKVAHFPETLVCDICGKRFCDKRGINRHMKGVHFSPSGLKRKCKICQNVFDTLYEFKEHRKKFHLEEPTKQKLTEDESKVKAPCYICGKLYNRKFIKQHIDSHSATPGFNCSKCPATFNLKKNLLGHEKRVHVVGRPYTCDVCRKNYKDKTELARHLKLHKQDWKSIECLQCQAKFDHRSSYRRHLKSHTGAKPFECDKCDKAFGTKQNLKQHSWSHSGLRPHYCDICEKGYYKRSEVAEHKLKVHGI